MKEHRATYLTTYDLHRLDLAVAPLARLCPDIYLVGTVLTSPDFRDVDVRMILADEEFDALFTGRLSSSTLWEAFCLTATAWLRAETGLPIDFQVQRRTEANEKHHGVRNHLSGGRRHFAALGDGTPYLSLPVVGEERPGTPGAETGDGRWSAPVSSTDAETQP